MRANKYNARKVQQDGYTFDSKREAARYGELKLLVCAAEISELTVHPKFILTQAFLWHGKHERAIKYIGDFMYREGSTWVVEDVKGGRATQTAAFRIKAKLFKLYFPEYDFRIV